MADKQTVSTSSRLKRLSQAQLDDIIEGSVSDQESSDFDNDSTVDPDYNPGESSDKQINKSGDDSSDEVPDLQSSQSDDNCCIKASKHSNQTSGHNKTSYSDENCNNPSTSNVNKTQIDDYGIHSDSGDTETEGDGIRPTARCHQRTGKPLTRKRKRDPSSWKKHVRKQLRQSGQQYVDSRGKLQSARSVKSTKDCSKCKFKCSLNINDNDRSRIFAEFWSLNDDEKRHFFAKTTKCENVNRPSKSSRKRLSYRYFVSFNGVDYRVCKQFYLSTLSISQKRISNYHKSKNPVGGTPTPLKWGKSVNREIPPDVKEGIRAHIQAIPRIESHYCRSSTNKEYLAEGLSINVLYEKYLHKCHVSGSEPGKLHLYREIFNSEFNIAFHTPKKDRCDHCEASAMIESPTEGQQRSHAEHLRGKAETKAERDKDRSDKVNMVVCFDLQNVLLCPQRMSQISFTEEN